MRVGINEPAARFTNFSNALEHANESAKLGLVSPAVLTTGFLLRDFGDAAGIDMSQMTRSRRFGPLWKTVTRRLDELYAEERIKQRKIAKNPVAYVCAAEGCGIRAEERAALRKCAGRCPPDLKPHYCSPECQKKVSVQATERPIVSLTVVGLAEAQGRMQARFEGQDTRH